MDAQQALTELLALGIAPAMAQSLVKKHDPAIYSRRHGVCVLPGDDRQERSHPQSRRPADLLPPQRRASTGGLRYLQEAPQQRGRATPRRRNDEHVPCRPSNLAFDTWRSSRLMPNRLHVIPGPALSKKIAEVVAQRSKSDKYFIRVTRHSARS